jgi:flagellar motor switch/type III secretory pathway protein FliN
MANAEAAPYLVLGETRRRRLQARLGELLEDWYRNWAADPTPGGAHPELAIEVSQRESALRGDVWTFVAARGEETLLKTTVPIDVLRVLSGVGPAGTGVFTHTMDGSRGDGFAALLTERVATTLCTDITKAALPADHVSVRRVGAASAVGGVVALASARRNAMMQTLLVSIGTDKPRPLLELTLTPTIMDALLANRPAIANAEGLTGRRKASQEQPVTVNAVLGTAKVSWRDLQALCVGDVIVLEQNLSAPCTLRVGADVPVADAQLGRIGNSLAAQVTRIHTAS